MENSERSIRSTKLPVQLYGVLKLDKAQSGCTARELVRAAVDEELAAVERLLKEAGLAPMEGNRKLVRLSLDKAVDNQLQECAERIGIDVTTLVLACLRRNLGLRTTDKNKAKRLKEAADFMD